MVYLEHAIIALLFLASVGYLVRIFSFSKQESGCSKGCGKQCSTLDVDKIMTQFEKDQAHL